MTPHDETARLVHLLQEGDQCARNDLIDHTYHRLEQLAHRMLRGFSVVRRYDQTGDILHPALERLWKALKDVQVESVIHYYNLATQHIRWELLTLARRYSGPESEPAKHQTDSHDPETGILARQPARSGEPSSVAEWRELLEAIEKLPEGQKEVMVLHIFHGLTLEEVGQLLGVCEKTVQRRLNAARCRLDELFPQSKETFS
jgi:RNA polymerase sigma factor (sigma-70 family)